jgi:peptidoglycan hydrolase CwlO-like protein
MAAAGENQGLKIAVAVFIALTVILAVTTYVGFSNSAYYSAKMDDAIKKESAQKKAAQQALSQIQELRTLVNSLYANVDDFDALKTALKKDTEKLGQSIHAMAAEVKKRIDEYRQAGGNDPKVNDLETAVNQVIASYDSEPNKSLMSSLDRLRELLQDQVLLTVAFSLDNIVLSHQLKDANQIAQAKIDEHDQAKKKAEEDLNAEHADHEKQRQDLLAKVDKLSTERINLATQIENLKTTLTQTKEDYEKKLADLRGRVNFLNDEYQKKETVMDVPDGVITYVDYTRMEVATNMTRQLGVRPHMIFAVFDQREPIPNDKPKATIEITAVDDRGSIGRIIKFKSGYQYQTPADIPNPIREGDYVYSSAWSPNNPQRFALIGRIDLNRDGKDDRADLKRLIEAAGGTVEYDLPPPGAGKETGKLTALCNYYVIDERPTLVMPGGRERIKAGATLETAEFNKRKTEIIREARQMGVRPLPIERLLTYLGYRPGLATPGRVEAFDQTVSDQILYPRGRTPAQSTLEPGTENAPSETPPAAPGDDEKGSGDKAKENAPEPADMPDNEAPK